MNVRATQAGKKPKLDDLVGTKKRITNSANIIYRSIL
jgi:hypothetical protein